MSNIGGLIASRSRSAAVSWLLLAVLFGVAVVNLVDGDLLWAGLATAVLVVALVPTALTGDPEVVVAWEALAVSTVPIVAHVAGIFAEPVTYVAVAGIAIVVAVEIATFSSAEMPAWFAVLFVVMTTMTVAAGWSVVQFASDYYLGTSLLASRQDLMWNLVGATAVGVAAGIVFQLYFEERTTAAPGDAGGA